MILLCGHIARVHPTATRRLVAAASEGTSPGSAPNFRVARQD